MNIVNKINLKLLYISFIVFFIVIVLRYIGPHHNLFFAIEYKLNNHFSDDLHITNSIIVNSGAYYFLFKYFLANDYLGLLIHVVFSFIAILYLFKILELIKEIKITEIFIILIGFLTLDHFVMPYVRTATAFIGQHHSSSIGLYLIFPCIFYSLKNNLIKYCIFLTLSVLISPKLALFSNLILSIFFITNSKFKIKNFIPLFLLFIIVIYFYYLNSGMEGQISKADKLAIIELLFLRGSEDSINSQRWIFQLTLLFSFITYFILLILNKNFFSHTFYNLHIIVFVFSLALCILSYIYTSSFYKIIPVPKLVMLSPVRNLILFQMLFFILFCIWILKSNSNNIAKIFYIGSLIYWNISYKLATPFQYWYLPSFMLFFVGTFFHVISNNKRIGNFINIINSNIALFCIILLLFPIIYFLAKERLELFSMNSLLKTQRIYSDISSHTDLENYMLDLRICKNFTMHVSVQDKNNLTNSFAANHLAMKSSFYLDFYTMNDYQTMQLALERDKYIDKINNYLLNNDNVIEKDLLEIIGDNNLLLVIKKDKIYTINNLKNVNCKKIKNFNF